ncbi:cellulose signaling related protein ooc1 [Drechmeria coniospora]|uniref:Cellulose signaling related protein ooc1 n=1 Tax=Drechmeria coniospora TaxID=98403 RepID=A0A151GAH1_DRECN|nr:cellulose signaling related protein ooc1 [Drechmeria coniospora]KYK54084.1 cellulose signaling related protein ooc1 [Drechmeria coniospora]ODA77604.1 hypothetical protein RJ55_07233 [Drechmeria coniospora]
MLCHSITKAATTVLVAFAVGANAFTTPCIYQQYKCGYNLIANQVYTDAELTAAVNTTGPIPPIESNQLLQVLYRCIDTNGAIAGNSYCISGCISMPGNDANDQCAM